MVRQDCFRDISLPKGLTLANLQLSMEDAISTVGIVNSGLATAGLGSLDTFIQKNNFSGIVSNILTNSLDKHTPYRNNSDIAYPDLIADHGTGLEIKCTIRASKGGESHNGHSGWHLIASYEMDQGQLRFSCIKIADLVGYGQPDSDWNYCGSQRNEKGSQRTETYTTNPLGRKKLLDGIVYLDPQYAPNWKRWR